MSNFERDSNIYGIRKDRRTKLTDAEIIELIDARVAAGIAAATQGGSVLDPNAVQLTGDVTGINTGNQIPASITPGAVTLTKMASSAQAYLLARANHTGTQAATTVTIADAGNYYASGDVEGALQEAALQTLRVFTVGTLPSATGRALIYVSDLAGGPEPCFSDGTNWRRCSDKTVAS